MRPLSETQIDVLYSYYSSGSWPHGGWYWTNYSTTKRISDSLVKRGLLGIKVLRNAQGHCTEHYHITKAGSEIVLKHFPHATKRG